MLRLLIALLFVADVALVVGTGLHVAHSQTTELSLPYGQNGTDFSANSGSFAGITLLSTIPALTTGTYRRGVFIQAQCAAGLTIVLDDGTDTTPPTVIVLSGASFDGGQGSSLDLTGSPHTGRIRIYSVDPNCQMGARAW